MASSKLRKVKEVNGWKVNHPHSASNIFYMIFTLAVICTPFLFLYLYNFYHFVQIVDPGTGMPVFPFYERSGFTGVDLLRFGITYIMFLVGAGPAPITHPLMAELVSDSTLLGPYIPYFYVASAGILALIIIFSIVLAIIFLVHLVKGYLRHSRAVRVFTALNFVLSILYSSIFLVLYFYAKINVSIISPSDPNFGAWLNYIGVGTYLICLIVIAAIYEAKFKESIPEVDLEYHEDAPVVEHLSKVHEVTKIKYEGSSSLPPNLTNIGGHAFAENQNLVVANIPLNITKLGPGAFANCLKLKVVSIPTSVVEIGFNCFFNCVELNRINYAGTKAEWKKITRGSNWLAKAKTSEVTCTDGVIIVNPYH